MSITFSEFSLEIFTFRDTILSRGGCAIFGDTLKDLREQRGMTQKELAEKLGSSKSTISMMENGKRFPSFDMLKNIASALNVAPSALLGEGGDLLLGEMERGQEIGEDARAATLRHAESRADLFNFDFEAGYQRAIDELASLSEDEQRLLSLYRELNQEGQEKLIDYADDMVRSGKYIKSDPHRMVEGQA
jgi:transcriptional regulator with XRE-family HTH domain